MPIDLEVNLAVPPSDQAIDGSEPVVLTGVPVVATEEGTVALSGAPVPSALEVAKAVEGTGFTGKRGKSLVLRAPGGGGAYALLGLGPADDLDAEGWRRAGAALIRAAGELEAVELALPGGTTDGFVAALVEGAGLATYRFDEFRATSPHPRRVLTLRSASPELLQGAVTRGLVVARAVGFARDLINTPPSDLPPSRLAERAVEHLAGRPGIEVEVWDESRLETERLGALLGVSRGSVEPPRMIRATYTPTTGGAHHLVFVGKGITFDSGGLSLKTAEGMTTMKTDMSGAAAVLAALGACAELGLGVRVTALAPVSENMPGGRAMKPGDVLTARNGTTIEVLNTDAEGRLVLADALSLAAEIEPAPDAIVDLATLTGAAKVALGNDIAALFANDDLLAEQVETAARAAGEAVWRLPLVEDYADHVDSEVADLKNTGRPGQAGAIVAALILERFVGDRRWAHLDIAGPGRSAESSGYLSKGGTAFGTRTLVELAASFDDTAAGDGR